MEQLLSALAAVGVQYSDVTIAVMLATVAGAEMPASDLCFEILTDDPRYGVTDLSDLGDADLSERVDAADHTLTAASADIAPSDQQSPAAPGPPHRPSGRPADSGNTRRPNPGARSRRPAKGGGAGPSGQKAGAIGPVPHPWRGRPTITPGRGVVGPSAHR